MTKKDRKTISQGIAALFVLAGGFLYWQISSNIDIYLLLGAVFAFVIIEGIIYQMLPAKKKKPLRKRKAPAKPRQNSGKQSEKKTSNRLRDNDEIISSPLEELSWREFERLCYLYFEAKGFRPKETSEGADGGIDLVLYNQYGKPEEAIQIKHYLPSGNQITVKEIRELDSAKKNHGCALATFITSSRFSNPARVEADQRHIECHDINWVNNKIGKWQKTKAKKKSS